MAVDLATGDRTLLGGNVDVWVPVDLERSAKADLALAVDLLGKAVLAVDPLTGGQIVLSDAVTGAGPALLYPAGTGGDR